VPARALLEVKPRRGKDWRTMRIGAMDRHVASRIRRARKQRGLKIAELAAAIGKSAAQMQKYESAQNACSPTSLHAIARVLQFQPGWFFQDFDPDADLVFDDPDGADSPGVPESVPLTTEVHALAQDIMLLDRQQRRAVVQVVKQFRALAPDFGAGDPMDGDLAA